MTSIKDDLTNYLSRERKEDSTSNVPLLPLSATSSLNVLSYFKNTNDTTEDETESNWIESAKKDCCPNLNRFQRICGFLICLLMGIFCFTLSFFFIPVLILKARKFSLLYSLGSIFFICSFSFLWGPLTHLKLLFAKERILFSSIYLCNIFLTIYCAMIIQNTPLTIFCAVIQFISLLWFLSSYIPGGTNGMKFFSKIFSMSFKRTISSTLPV